MIRTLMSKVISILLVVTLLTTVTVPALCAERTSSQISQETLESFYGYTFTENILSDDKVEITSYYYGEPQKLYTVEVGNPLIYVETLSEVVTRSGNIGNTYTIPAATIIKTTPITPYAERWAILGYINYSEHTNLGYVRGYTSTYGNSSISYTDLNASRGTPLDDIVVFLESFLLSEGYLAYISASGVSISALAASLVASVLATLSVEVINGIIDSAVSDRVESVETSWDFRITSFADVEVADGIDAYLYDQGTTKTIRHTNADWETWDDEITFSDWQSPTLAIRAWNELFPIYSFPGLDGFSRY